MEKLGLLARLTAKPGKENEVEAYLTSALQMARREDKTISWYAFKIDDFTFGIFDTFEDQDGREAHLNGEIAKGIMENASRLLSEDPKIEKINILASK